MKRVLTILFLFLVINYPSFSQRGEKLESLKVGFLTNKLNLDARTAEQFWPLYHQYENELMVVVQERRRMNQNETRNADEILDQEQKALDIKRKYSNLFSKVISGEQLNQLYRAEKEFRQMVIKRSQKKELNFRNNNERTGRFDRNQQNMEPRPRNMPVASPRDQQPRPAPANNGSNYAPPARNQAPEPSLDRKGERMRR
ncbi:MAG: hypothetical protein IPK62_06240 [Bacteroidetes bacterium]|nr:hypothetical protein [Bacteroidota bacterium]MBK8144614.1 hypothetical protein [Bacteroidota bacterium]MBP6315846.1 hypothetical protein [Chitinophagaceae bacterium]